MEATKLLTVEMEKKRPEIEASSADEERPEQHAIDVSREEHGEGEDIDAVGERVAVPEEVQSKKKSKRVAALDANHRGTYTFTSPSLSFDLNFDFFPCHSVISSYIEIGAEFRACRS
jgi:hypothetical protein